MEAPNKSIQAVPYFCLALLKLALLQANANRSLTATPGHPLVLQQRPGDAAAQDQAALSQLGI